MEKGGYGESNESLGNVRGRREPLKERLKCHFQSFPCEFQERNSRVATRRQSYREMQQPSSPPVVTSPTAASSSGPAVLVGLMRRWQALLDSTTPHKMYRWTGFGLLAATYILRVAFLQGWYIVTVRYNASLLLFHALQCSRIVHAGNLSLEFVSGLSLAKV